jgi:hypothetical protein
VDARQGVLISGLPGHDIEDLQLSNIRIYYKGGGSKDSVNRVVPEYEKDYPEPGRWKVLPSYGFFIRHVKNLKLHDVQVSFMKDDLRPPFILDDVKGAILYDIQAQKMGTTSSFILKNVKDINIEKARDVKDAVIKSAERKEL